MAPVDVEENERIVHLASHNDWRTLLKEHSRNNFLPWIWPSVDDLHFIADAVKQSGASRVVSIGCGSALFEWLLNQSTGIPVKCVEVDKSWWTCKYSTTFLPLEFVNEFAAGDDVADVTDAILFCYFNNEAAFVDYLRLYTGQCLIVIGPGAARGTHANPTPFQLPACVNDTWTLHSMREIHSGHDFTAVFHRKM